MSTFTLNTADSAIVNTAALQACFDNMPSGGVVTIPSGTFQILDLEIPGAITLRSLGRTTFVSPVLESGDGSPMVWVTGAGVTLDGIVFDGQRELQPDDGYSDSIDGGGLLKLGRSYRCAVRADIDSGIVGQSAPHNLTVQRCEFQRLYGAGLLVRGGADIVIDRCAAWETSFELAHVSQGFGSVSITDCNLRYVGSGHASVNADGFVVGQADPFVFTGNVGQNVERALIKCSVDNGTISGNHLRHNNQRWRGASSLIAAYPAIQLEVCDTVSVYRNKFYDVGSGITVSNADVNLIDIDDNVINGTNGTSNADGIGVSPGGVGVRIRGNYLRNISRHGVHASGPIEDFEVLGNRIMGSDESVGAGIWVANSGATDFEAPVFRGNVLKNHRGLGGYGVFGFIRTGAGGFNDVVVSQNIIDARGSQLGRAGYWYQGQDYLSGSVTHNEIYGSLTTSDTELMVANNNTNTI